MQFCERKAGGKEEHYSEMCGKVGGAERVKEIPEWWMERHWKGVTKGTAAGPSKCSADMIAAAPKFVRELIRCASNVQMTTGLQFPSMKRSFIHPVPKADPGDYRPLRLVEVVAKAQRKWMIMGCNKVWEEHGLLNPNNFGFRPGISIDQALRIKTNIIEDALFYKKELAMLNDDMARCFDSVERMWQRIALKRLGVPDALVEQLVAWEEANKVEVITGYGMSGDIGEEGVFEDECGVPQGDTASPLIFVATYTLLQDWVDVEAKGKGYVYTVPQATPQTHVGFADDMTYMAGEGCPDESGEKGVGAWENLRAITEATDTALGAMCLKRHLGKCKWSALRWVNGEMCKECPGRLTTTVYTPSSGVGWNVKQATHEIGFLPPDVTVKDLGLHRSMMLIPGEHFNKIKEKLMTKVGILARKRLTSPAVRYMLMRLLRRACATERNFWRWRSRG